jgi:methylglutamate dehydrogenase subunit D
MFDRRSALGGIFASAPRPGAKVTGRLAIGEVRGWSLDQVAAFASRLEELQSAVRPILGIVLPQQVGLAVKADGRFVLKTGTEQFWILGPETGDLSKRLRAAVTPEIGAITPLSHSRTRIFIQGSNAREVLARGIPVDFRPEVFGIGRFAMTGVHHTPVLVHRIAADRYDIYAMRTFALSVWEWLADAALPFGYDIEAPAA